MLHVWAVWTTKLSMLLVSQFSNLGHHKKNSASVTPSRVLFLILVFFTKYSTQQTVCSQNPCTRGTCLVSANGVGFSCQCPAGYTGLLCETSYTSTVTLCYPNPCKNSGVCRLVNSLTYACNCPPNYTGSRCEVSVQATSNVCPASANVCLNGGTCVYSNSRLTCICLSAFTGTRCELSMAMTTVRPFINPCASNPCAYGSTCLYSSGTTSTFACYCAAGYQGTLCNVPIVFTTTNSYTTTVSACNSPYACLNGGTCVPVKQPNVNPPYACVCLSGYTGLRCETVTVSSATVSYTPPTTTQFNPCASNPCLYGTCLPITNTITYVCVCSPNYTGFNCQQQISATSTTTRSYYNSCASYPCINGGTCVPIYQANVNPPYACLCPVTYTGQQCEQPLSNINACTSNPCKLGSTCVASSSGSYTCLCPAGYTGITCNTLVSSTFYSPTIANGCVSNPCLNGATCTTSQFGYLCQCATGYMGVRCEQVKAIDLCTYNSCYNGGTCTTVSNAQLDQYTVMCFCPSGYTGSRCQTPTGGFYTITLCQCLNGGSCNYDGSCRCLPNYYGTRCEYAYQYSQVTVSASTASPSYMVPSGSASGCPTGLCVQGKCAQIPQGAAYYCICDWGWSGPRCNIRNFCQSYYNTCKNGAQCINTYNGFSCSCNAGTTGQYCETTVQVTSQNSSVLSQPALVPQKTCSTSICLNGGTCYIRSTDNQIACQCRRNYIGLRCEQDICKQPALPGPCLASMPRYYYNSVARQCQLFTYGGCNGNENNFGTLDVCNYNCYGH